MKKTPIRRGREGARQEKYASRHLWCDGFAKDLVGRLHTDLRAACLVLLDLEKRVSKASAKQDFGLVHALMEARALAQMVLILARPRTEDEFRCKALVLVHESDLATEKAVLTAAEAVLIEDAIRLNIADTSPLSRFCNRPEA